MKTYKSKLSKYTQMWFDCAWMILMVAITKTIYITINDNDNYNFDYKWATIMITITEIHKPESGTAPVTVMISTTELNLSKGNPLITSRCEITS